MRGRIWQSSALLDRVILPLLAGTMHAAWIVPLVNAAFGSFAFSPAGVRMPLWLPIVVLYSAYTLAHVAPQGRGGRTFVAVAGVVVALAAGAYLLPDADAGTTRVAYYWEHIRSWSNGMPVAVGTFALCIALWLRGVTVEWTEIDALRHGLLTGSAALALLALVGGTSQGLGLTPEGGLSEAMLLFVLSALLTLAFADIARTVAQSDHGAASTPLGRYWFATVTLVVLGVVAVAWLVGLVANPESAAALMRLVSPVLRFLRDAFAYVLMGIAYVIFWLLSPLLSLISGLTEQAKEEEQLIEVAPQATADLGEAAQRPVHFDVPPWAQIALVTVILTLIALAIYSAVRRRRASVRDGVLETRELDWSWGQMQEQLRRVLGGRKRAAQPQYLPIREPADPRAVIRFAYRRVLVLAADRGLERQRGQTPFTYGVRLSQALPALAEPIEELTRAYVLARYAPLLPPEAVVAAAVSAAKRIEEYMAQSQAAARDDGSVSG